MPQSWHSNTPPLHLQHLPSDSSLEAHDARGASFKDSKDGDKRAAPGAAAAFSAPSSASPLAPTAYPPPPPPRATHTLSGENQKRKTQKDTALSPQDPLTNSKQQRDISDSAHSESIGSINAMMWSNTFSIYVQLFGRTYYLRGENENEVND